MAAVAGPANSAIGGNGAGARREKPSAATTGAASTGSAASMSAAGQTLPLSDFRPAGLFSFTTSALAAKKTAGAQIMEAKRQ